MSWTNGVNITRDTIVTGAGMLGFASICGSGAMHLLRTGYTIPAIEFLAPAVAGLAGGLYLIRLGNKDEKAVIAAKILREV